MRAIDLLRKEHAMILLALDVCEAVATRIREGEEVESGEIARLMDFLRNYAHRYHHAKEDRVLLPWIESRAGAAETEMAAWLRREHLTAEAYLSAVVASSRQLPESRAAFLQHLGAYVALTRWQLGMEESVILSIAEYLGDFREDGRLLDGFEEAVPDAELIEARYYLVLKQLEEALGLDPSPRSMRRYLEEAA